MAMRRVLSLAVLGLALMNGAEGSQEIRPGTVIASVATADDPEQSYAVYLPSDYSPERAWSVLFGFHPGARGAALVETYRAAAERYGYIVAGSNTSRNGSWDTIKRAVRAMSRDVGRRFTVDAARIYLTGHSGGARVAMEVALGPNDIAGVIASSAGFPDAKPRRSVSFPIFATAGVDDFNYLELKRLDATLTTPHRLVVFDGGHTLPPVDVAQEAIEWLEVQAMRSGRRAKDSGLIERLFATRWELARRESDPAARLAALRAVANDFADLKDVSAATAMAAALEREPETRKAIARDRSALDAEARMLDDTLAVEARLKNAETRSAAIARLRQVFEEWSRAAGAVDPSPARSQARRLLGAVASGAAERVRDEQYRELVRQYRPRG